MNYFSYHSIFFIQPHRNRKLISFLCFILRVLPHKGIVLLNYLLVVSWNVYWSWLSNRLYFLSWAWINKVTINRMWRFIIDLMRRIMSNKMRRIAIDKMRIAINKMRRVAINDMWRRSTFFTVRLEIWLRYWRFCLMILTRYYWNRLRPN